MSEKKNNNQNNTNQQNRKPMKTSRFPSSKVIDSDYGTIQKVSNIYNEYKNNIKFPRETKDIEIIKNIKSELIELLRILKEQEQQFYQMLGKSNLQDAINEIKSRASIWMDKQTGAQKLIDPESFQNIISLQGWYLDNAKVVSLLNAYAEDFEQADPQSFDALGSSIDNITTQKIQATLNNIFNKQIVKRKSNLEEILEFQLNQNQEYRFALKGSDKRITKTMQKRIIKEINKNIQANPGQFSRAEKELKEINIPPLAVFIQNAICSNMNPEVQQIIVKEISSGLYNLNEDPNVIQGFLGEIYWTGLMKFIFSKNNDINANSNLLSQIKPMGHTKNIKNQDLMVDMVIESVGFQIKNWRLNKSEVGGLESITHTTSANNKRLGDFIVNRAEIPLDYGVGKIIAQMFGAISYNKPTDIFLNEDNQSNQNYQRFNSMHESMTQLQNNTINDLEFLFQSRIDRIIGITSNIRGTVANTKKTYQNTFWAINNYLIPSSAIIEELINFLDDPKLLLQGVNLRIKTYNDTKNDSKSCWPYASGINFNTINMANRWRLNYETTFDLTNLLKRAENSARPK